MELRIDPDFQSLCPPLTEEEYALLQASLLDEGCRQALDVWFPSPETSPFLLDGHNRYKICLEHEISFDIAPVTVVTTREEAWNWIIARQLGRRNITELQKSYLWGKRFNLEKNAQGAPEENTNAEKQTCKNFTFVLDTEDSTEEDTAQRLADERGVDRRTIYNDAEYAAALDTVDQEFPGTREEVLQPKSKKKPKTATRKQVIKTAKVVRKQSINLKLAFLKSHDWRDFERMEAVEILDTLPTEEHAHIDQLLNEPGIPGSTGILILRNLQKSEAPRRQQIYQLNASNDPRERSLAKTISANRPPSPDPQMTIIFNIRKSIDSLSKAYRSWQRQFPNETWTPTIEKLDTMMTGQLVTIATIEGQVKAAHQERIDFYGSVILQES